MARNVRSTTPVPKKSDTYLFHLKSIMLKRPSRAPHDGQHPLPNVEMKPQLSSQLNAFLYPTCWAPHKWEKLELFTTWLLKFQDSLEAAINKRSSDAYYLGINDCPSYYVFCIYSRCPQAFLTSQSDLPKMQIWSRSPTPSHTSLTTKNKNKNKIIIIIKTVLQAQIQICVHFFL